MHMFARAITTLMLSAWTVTKLHHFQLHYIEHGKSYAAAQLLLDSEVCVRAHLRMSLREFDNCDTAEQFVRVSPLNRAVYSLAEEMHVCGQNRCAILYMDITDRLSYIFACVALLLALMCLKLGRDYKRQSIVEQSEVLRLPQHTKKFS